MLLKFFADTDPRILNPEPIFRSSIVSRNLRCKKYNFTAGRCKLYRIIDDINQNPLQLSFVTVYIRIRHFLPDRKGNSFLFGRREK